MNESSDLKFDLKLNDPIKHRILPICCYLWLLTIFCVLYYQKFTGQFAFAYSLTIFISLFLTFEFVLPIIFIKFSNMSCILRTDGITWKKNFTPFDDILSINHQRFPPLHNAPYLKLKQKKVGFFSRPQLFKSKNICFPLHQKVYTDIIPYIIKLRPDLPVSPRIRRLVKNPELVTTPRYWLIFIALIINIILTNVLLQPSHQKLSHYLIIAGTFAIYPKFITISALILPKTTRDCYLEFTLQSPSLLAYIFMSHLFSSAEFINLQVLIHTFIIASLIAVVVLFFFRNLAKTIQASIVLILISTSFVTYYYKNSQLWPALDITPYIKTNDTIMPVWGRTGNYLADFSFEDKVFVLDITSLKKKPLPPHSGDSYVIWLDHRFLIRKILPENKIPELWAYNFTSNSEFHIPTADEFSIGYRQPLWTNGFHLAWIDHYQEDPNASDDEQLRFYNLQSMQEDILPYSLPFNISWRGAKAAWISESTIKVWCPERLNNNYSTDILHVFTLNLDNNQSKLFTSSHHYDRWYPINNFRYAFGVNRINRSRFSMNIVNLETDQSVQLSGEDLPLALSDSSCAYRVHDLNGRPYLVRLDFDTTQETPLYLVPDNTQLYGISKTGQFALLGPKEEIFSMPLYTIIHIPSGKKHRIQISGFGIALSRAEWSSVNPSVSPFSPDEKNFILESMGFDGQKIWLYTLPESW